MKKHSLLIVGLLTVASVSYAKNKPVYKDSTKSIDVRVSDLIKKMTLQEKIMQLNQIAFFNNNPNNYEATVSVFDPTYGSVIYFPCSPVERNKMQRKAIEQSRLGIPIIFGFDVIHGCRTIYPIPLAQSCSWNPELVEQLCAMAASEMKTNGVDWTFGPMIDVARDPRWGRVAEGYGEDPDVNSIYAAASVKGFQQNNDVAACLKHFVAYGESEGGRDYSYSDVSAQSLWETYLPPYKAGVDAGALTIMSGFNDITGVPASANHYTLTEVLRDKWGFEGFVVSDWGSVNQLVNQGYAEDNADAALKALTSGVDIDMVSFCYQNHLDSLVANKILDVKVIDKAVERVLGVKFKLGLFDNPYVAEIADDKRFLLPEYRQLARKSAQESAVLLKNDDNILPIKKGNKIALIGPLADSKKEAMGTWTANGVESDAITIYEGLVKRFGKDNILYASGCEIDGDDLSQISNAADIASQADVIVMCIGEAAAMTGEDASRSTLSLPCIQEKLLSEIVKLNKPIVTLVSSGRPINLTRIEPNSNALFMIWQLGVETGNAIADLLSGDANPSGRLSITIPRNEGQIPMYHSERQRSRPRQGNYRDASTSPMYKFGDGLSYSKFEYGKLKCSATKVQGDKPFTVKVNVTNNSNVDGSETIILYKRDRVASISQPYKKFLTFKKVAIPAGKSVDVEFELTPSQAFPFVDATGTLISESGMFDMMVKDQSVEIEWTK